MIRNEKGHFIFINGPRARWRLAPADGSRIHLRSLPGYMVMSPYHYGAAYQEHGFITGDLLIRNDDCVDVHVTGLILARSRDSTSISPTELISSIASLCRYLRYASNQFDLRTENPVNSWETTNTIVRGPLGSITGRSMSGAYRSYYLRSIITNSSFKEADLLRHKKFEIPIYEEILLDALSEQSSQRFRTAILYAAISIESMLRYRWELEHMSMLKRKRKHLPWMTGGAKEDYLFNQLIESDKFDTLLRDFAWYIRGASLQQVNEPLYTKAKKLYSTRNGLVHRGDVGHRKIGSTFSQDAKGCSEAILTTLELYNWMGMAKYDCFKVQGFVTQ